MQIELSETLHPQPGGPSMDILSPAWEAILAEAASASGLCLTPERLAACRNLAAMLAEWNRVHNLTAVRAPLDVAVRHFADSLHAAGALPLRGRVMDLGSGAGFPGLCVKIFLPRLSVTLVEARRKKVSFHKAAIAHLGLENIASIHARSEDLEGSFGFAGAFDTVVTRAVTDLSRLWDLAQPFLSHQGTLVAMKGPGVAEEIAELKGRLDMGGGWEIEEQPYALPGGLKRTLVKLRKTGGAPEKTGA
ncbi:MAG: 16S rRNA (guanine(527)-N(7))-methyltransferase RsmG [Proteobacteria bacterium]|nr:16S rRNA (guanine(527)-N(7))-methyltransferase RsmG [Pseudomonadota bacterium]